jgi:hypothetical protein
LVPELSGEGTNGVLNTRNRIMKLLTAEQRAQLLANGRAARQAQHQGVDFDPKPVVKLYIPDGYGRWLLTEMDPLEFDRAYGLYDLGIGRPEVGYVSLRELEDEAGKLPYPVKPDPRFVADRPLSAYTAVAYTRGLIVD